MPQAIPAIASTVGTVIFGAGTTGAVVATAVTSAALGLGFTYAVGAGLNALAGEPDVAGLDTQGGGRQLSFAPSSNMPRQIIYGETLVRGQPVLTKTSGTDRQNLDMIIAIGDAGPYESIEAIYFNEEELTLDGSGNVTSPSKYAGFAQIVTTLGSESQSAISDAVSNITEWTSAHTGKGVCHAYVRLVWDSEVWTGGQPQIKFKVRGRKVYDPRLDSTNGGSGSHRKDDSTTWEYSANRVLWALDWVRGVKMNGERVAGLGAPNALIDWGTWADAADAADEAVSVVGGGTISRYTGGGGQIGTDDDPAGVARGMAQCFAGEYAPRSGYIACYAGEARTATVTLSDDDLAGPIKLQTTRSMRDTVNTMQAQYREPEEDYDFTDAPQYQNGSWVSADGEEYYKQIGLPFEVDHRRAQRIAKIIAGRLREPRRLEATWKQKGLQVREGDAFTWSSDRFPAGVVGKYICTDRRINDDGTVFISARSEDDTKYSWNEATEEATRTTPASISEPDTAITVPVSSLDPDTNRRAIVGATPEYTLGLFFDASTYDSNGSGSVGFEDTLDLGSGFIRDSVGGTLTDDNTLNTSIEIDVNGALTNIGTASTPVANNFIGVVGGLITGIGAGVNTAVGNSLINIDGSGQLQGIGTGAGTVIDNTQITVASGVLTGIGTAGITVDNQSITVDGSGILQGIGTGSITVDNSSITVVSGVLTGIGTPSIVVDNSSITVDGSGVLQGIGTGSITVDNSSISVNATTGALSGIGTGNGTIVRNTEISLAADGTLSGAGSSSQIDATQIVNGVADAGATAGATWAGAGANISAIPANLSALTGSENIENSDITVDGSGILQGIGTASVTVDNQEITVNATTGVLEGIGTASVVVSNSNIAAGDIPTLAASKIGSGTFDNARIAETNVTQHQSAIDIAGSQITSGTVAAARIDDLDASKITSGTFGTTRVAASAITKEKISNGAVAVEYLNRDATHDWYSTTTPTGDWRDATNFNTYTHSASDIAVVAGDRVEIELSYDHVGVFNAYEQFTFKDMLRITIIYDDASVLLWSPPNHEKNRYVLGANNVGVPAGTAGTTEIVNSFIHKKVIDINSAYPWVDGSKTVDEIRVQANAYAVDYGSSGRAVHGNTNNQTYVRNSVQLEDVVLTIRKVNQGPTDNI